MVFAVVVDEVMVVQARASADECYLQPPMGHDVSARVWEAVESWSAENPWRVPLAVRNRVSLRNRRVH